MSDYDMRQVALLVIGGAVAWEGFYMVFKSVVLGGASYHPVFSGMVGFLVGTLMFVVGGLMAYGTYLEISDSDEEQDAREDPFDRQETEVEREREQDREQERGARGPTVNQNAPGTTAGRDRSGPERSTGGGSRGEGPGQEPERSSSRERNGGPGEEPTPSAPRERDDGHGEDPTTSSPRERDDGHGEDPTSSPPRHRDDGSGEEREPTSSWEWPDDDTSSEPEGDDAGDAVAEEIDPDDDAGAAFAEEFDLDDDTERR